MALALLLVSVTAGAELVPCRRGADAQRVAQALDRLQRSVDPCGESGEVSALLERLARCPRALYQICTSAEAARNLFDAPGEPGAATRPGTITWNPDLRSELEAGCDGDADRPVRRDPTASLLHEIVHAVHDCDGLSPGRYELEAVRIENIYRRAAGLCQRTRYGDALLPHTMRRSCPPVTPSAPPVPIHTVVAEDSGLQGGTGADAPVPSPRGSDAPR